jgi:hypothetical protein
MGRKLLSDILRNGDRDSLKSTWQETEAAAELAMLPPGQYLLHSVSGELECSSRKGTPGYKLKLKVAEGEYVGRFVWHDSWLTPAALPQTKRDLAKFGITDLDQLEQPLPATFVVKAKIALQRDDDGNERNRIRSFEVLGTVEPEKDAFAPAEDKKP